MALKTIILTYFLIFAAVGQSLASSNRLKANAFNGSCSSDKLYLNLGYDVESFSSEKNQPQSIEEYGNDANLQQKAIKEKDLKKAVRIATIPGCGQEAYLNPVNSWIAKESEGLDKGNISTHIKTLDTEMDEGIRVKLEDNNKKDNPNPKVGNDGHSMDVRSILQKNLDTKVVIDEPKSIDEKASEKKKEEHFPMNNKNTMNSNIELLFGGSFERLIENLECFFSCVRTVVSLRSNDDKCTFEYVKFGGIFKTFRPLSNYNLIEFFINDIKLLITSDQYLIKKTWLSVHQADELLIKCFMMLESNYGEKNELLICNYISRLIHQIKKARKIENIFQLFLVNHEKVQVFELKRIDNSSLIAINPRDHEIDAIFIKDDQQHANNNLNASIKDQLYQLNETQNIGALKLDLIWPHINKDQQKIHNILNSIMNHFKIRKIIKNLTSNFWTFHYLMITGYSSNALEKITTDLLNKQVFPLNPAIKNNSLTISFCDDNDDIQNGLNYVPVLIHIDNNQSIEDPVYNHNNIFSSYSSQNDQKFSLIKISYAKNARNTRSEHFYYHITCSTNILLKLNKNKTFISNDLLQSASEQKKSKNFIFSILKKEKKITHYFQLNRLH